MSLKPPTASEIKLFREKTGLSQAKLAARTGYSLRAVESWETNQRPAPPVLRLAFAAINAGLEPWDMLGVGGGRVVQPAP